MGRSYNRKTEKKDPEVIKQALAAIRDGGKIRTIARAFNVPRTTLRCRLSRLSRANKVDLDTLILMC